MPTNQVESEDTGLENPDEIFGDQTEEPIKPDTAPPKHAHPASLVQKARLYGMPQTDIDKLPTDDLAEIVFTLTRKEALLEQQHMRNQTWQPQAAPAPQPAPPPPEESEDDTLNHIEREGLDPKLVSFMRKQAKKIKDLEGASGRVKELEETMTQRQIRSNEDAYDAAFESLGPKFSKIFGQGDGRDLQPQGREMERRLAALQRAKIDQKLDSPTAIQRKIARAARELFEDLLHEEPAPEPKSDLGAYAASAPKKNGTSGRITQEQWDNGALATPTGRKAPAKEKGDKGAIEAIKAKYREWGLSEDNEDEQFSGVPKQ